MKLIDFSLNAAQVEILLLNDSSFRSQVISKLFANAPQTLETFVGNIIKQSAGSKISAIKFLRASYKGNESLFEELPIESFYYGGGLGLAGAKKLVDKYWDKYAAPLPY